MFHCWQVGGGIWLSGVSEMGHLDLFVQTAADLSGPLASRDYGSCRPAMQGQEDIFILPLRLKLEVGCELMELEGHFSCLQRQAIYPFEVQTQQSQGRRRTACG